MIGAYLLNKWHKVRDLLTRLHGIYQRGKTSDVKAKPYAHDKLKLLGVRASAPQALNHQASSSDAYQSGYWPQGVSKPHQENQQKIPQLSSIYSGIGVGVYQGEIVPYIVWFVKKL